MKLRDRIACCFGFHDDVFLWTDTRMWIGCPTCGKESEGWDITPAARWRHKVTRFRKRLRLDRAA